MTPLELLRSRRTSPPLVPLSRLTRIDRIAGEGTNAGSGSLLNCGISEISEIRLSEPHHLDVVTALLDRLEGAGLVVRVEEGSLLVGPFNKLTGDYRVAIRRHRNLMIALIESAEAMPAFDVDVLTCSDSAISAVIRDHPELSLDQVLEANDLGHELKLAGLDAIAAFRWFARHPAPGYDRGDHLAALLAIRQAVGRC